MNLEVLVLLTYFQRSEECIGWNWGMEPEDKHSETKTGNYHDFGTRYSLIGRKILVSNWRWGRRILFTTRLWDISSKLKFFFLHVNKAVCIHWENLYGKNSLLLSPTLTLEWYTTCCTEKLDFFNCIFLMWFSQLSVLLQNHAYIIHTREYGNVLCFNC